MKWVGVVVLLIVLIARDRTNTPQPTTTIVARDGDQVRLRGDVAIVRATYGSLEDGNTPLYDVTHRLPEFFSSIIVGPDLVPFPPAGTGQLALTYVVAKGSILITRARYLNVANA
jgi:hypothetical protein